jgi:outer membrane protein OmpA-like peptidoglycan-associated protein
VAAAPIAPTRIVAPVAPTQIIAPVVPNAPVIESVKPVATITKVGLIHMSSNSYLLTSLIRQKLKVLAKRIKATDAKTVFVDGHTDIRAGISNVWLSEQRASAVAKYLRPLLGGKKLTIRWFASRKPIASGLSRSSLAKNRRVEIWTE